MKQILLTNDDGIRAPGLIRLAEAAREFGEIVIVAPETEQSAKSHCITIRKPLVVTRQSFPVAGVTAWSCDGTPADCVRMALACLLPEKPDLVLSGINYGYNIATDIQYSGTVGAAMEAAHEGIPAIALSEPLHPDHTVTDLYLTQVLAGLIDRKPGRDVILNVNFPLGSCKGILTDRTVSAGTLYRSRFHPSEEQPDGSIILSPEAYLDGTCEEGTDLEAVTNGYISIGTVRNIG